MSERLSRQIGFNTDPYEVALPRDFVSACAGLDSESILLLIHFFSTATQTPNLPAHIRQQDLLNSFSKWHGVNNESLQETLNALIESHFLLQWQEKESVYLIAGTPEGRFLLQELKLGERDFSQPDKPITLNDERPNIFKLYETHIGIITPMMAEQLKQDEIDFPADWIEDAIEEAVQRNARNWKYVRAILLAWKDRGRDKQNERHQSDIDAFRKLTREQSEQQN